MNQILRWSAAAAGLAMAAFSVAMVLLPSSVFLENSTDVIEVPGATVTCRPLIPLGDLGISWSSALTYEDSQAAAGGPTWVPESTRESLRAVHVANALRACDERREGIGMASILLAIFGSTLLLWAVPRAHS